VGGSGRTIGGCTNTAITAAAAADSSASLAAADECRLCLEPITEKRAVRGVVAGLQWGGSAGRCWRWWVGE
jgi:hypothetical protein